MPTSPGDADCKHEPGVLQPVIDRTFGFDEAIDAYRHLKSGAHFGKVVIRQR